MYWNSGADYWVTDDRQSFKQFHRQPAAAARLRRPCAIVEQMDGVRFRDLFERLPKDQAADGDAALQQAPALAQSPGRS